MTNLYLLHTEPPDVDSGDGGGDDEQGSVVVDVSVLGQDWTSTNTSVSIPGDQITPDRVAQALIQSMRATACAYDPSVQLAVEHRLITWGR